MTTGRRRYILLDEPCLASEIPRMMCRVVSDVHIPLFNYAPKEALTLAKTSTEPELSHNTKALTLAETSTKPELSPSTKVPNLAETSTELERSHNTNDLIPNILPMPSLTTNRKDFLSTITDRSLNVKVSKFFGLDGTMSNEQKLNFETKEVRRYTINNPGDYFNVLLGDELYDRDVRALLKEVGKGHLVIGFLTTSGAQYSDESSTKTSLEGTATAPVTEVLGAPPIPNLDLDPTFGAKGSMAHKANRAHLSPDEEIFAVAYAPVKTKILDLLKKKPRLYIGRPKPVSSNTPAFGRHDGDSSDDDSPDDDEAPKETEETDKGDEDIILGANGDPSEKSMASFEF